MSEFDCHKCPLLEYDYEEMNPLNRTFVFRCNGTVAYSTTNLKKGREDFCEMVSFMVRI